MNEIYRTYLILSIVLLIGGLVFFFFQGGVFGNTTFNVAINTNPDLENGLVGHWSFDGKDIDTSSTTAEVLDRSGNSNNGDWANHATTTVPGKIGQAIDFDGVDDEIVLDNLDDFDMSQEDAVTIAAWVYPDNEIQGNVVFSRGDANSAPQNSTYHLYVYNSDPTRWEFETSSGVDTLSNITDVGTVSNQEWQHVVGVWNGSGKLTSFYKNSILIDSIASTTHTLWNGDDSLDRETSIGADGRNENANFNGNIDDVRVYNRALSAEEITRLYQIGATTKINTSVTSNPDLENGLVGHWSFDGKDMDLSSTTGEIRDRSINSNDGDWQNHENNTLAGRIGQAIDLDGINDVVEFPDVLDSGTGDLTVSVWIKTTTPGDQGIVTKRQNSVSTEDGYSIKVSSDGDLDFFFSDGDSGVGGSVEAHGKPITDGNWHHAVMVIDRTVDIKYGYRDGVEVTNTDISSITATQDNTNIFTFGQRNNGSGFLNGSIDDVRIYNRALSAEEVTRLYQIGATTKINTSINTNPDLENGLVGHYTFDGKDIDTSSTTAEVLDRSGQGNNGDWANHATTTVPGKIGQAIEFDGVDDDIILDNLDDFDMSQEDAVTIAAWVYPTPSAVIETIFSRGTPGGSANNEVYSIFRYHVDPRRWRADVSTGSSQVIAFTPVGSVRNNEWQHLVMVWDGPGDLLAIYIDGALSGSAASSTAIVWDGDEDADRRTSIGASGRDGNAIIEGKLDDVRIYNRALSAEEVTRLYNLGR